MKTMRNRKGTAIVEFAILLPLLLVIIFGTIEFGLLMYNKQVITNASREGARAGIVQVKAPGSRPDKTAIKAVVDKYAVANLVSFATTKQDPETHLLSSVGPPPVVDENAICASFGNDLIVQVKYTYRFLAFPNLIKLAADGTFSNSIDLIAQTDMRCE